MSLMILSVSSQPYSDNGIAGIVLMVSVTDEDGEPYTGLHEQNFHVRWIFGTTTEVSIESMTAKEYTVANGLPDEPGVYALEVMSKDASWSPPSTNIITFLIRVKEDENHGQVLYTVEYPYLFSSLP